MSFLIEHPDGRQYEVEVLTETRKRDGFTIAKTQPRWGVVPTSPSTALRDKMRGGKSESKDDGAAE